MQITNSSHKAKSNRNFYTLFSILLIILSPFAFLALMSLFLVCLTLLVPNDSWNHYVSGGSFLSNSGTMSPDGEYLVFGSPKSGRGDLWRIRLKDSTLHQMTNSEDFETDPRYSPDGKSIFYVRERGGHRHIWKTDKEGQFHEQLTLGWVIDDLVDISPDGDSLILGRAYPQTGGLGIAVGSTMIYSVSNKKFMEEDIGSRGYFLDDRTLLYNTRYGAGEKIIRFGKYDLVSRQKKILGTGFIECLAPNKKIVCISKGQDRSFLNRELVLFDLDQQVEYRIGMGRYPCFVDDSQVFFVRSSPNKAYTYSLENGTIEEIDLPGAILTTPAAATNERGVLLRLVSKNDRDRSGNIYLFHDNGIICLTNYGKKPVEEGKIEARSDR